MSYDLAIWEGGRPETDAEATRVYEQLAERMYDGDPPSERIRGYVEALLQRWPEDQESEDVPWSDGPLIGNASGGWIYFGIRPARADEVATYAAELAQQHGLVCYDPQEAALRPPSWALDADESDGPPHSSRGWLNWLRNTLFGR
ncbi:hypothetical protein [Microlunatus elymi]|uniref:hypothetical protein n=1 Tax=Microlunatus elymi TaxID=2596828 RepID=UPI001AF0194A|nr:hypothetical protein [Microlunatus elymi]